MLKLYKIFYSKDGSIFVDKSIPSYSRYEYKEKLFVIENFKRIRGRYRIVGFSNDSMLNAVNVKLHESTNKFEYGIRDPNNRVV